MKSENEIKAAIKKHEDMAENAKLLMGNCYAAGLVEDAQNKKNEFALNLIAAASLKWALGS